MTDDHDFDRLARAWLELSPDRAPERSVAAVLHAIDILDRSTETQLQIIDAETSARATRAELWRYLAPSRFTPTLSSQL